MEHRHLFSPSHTLLLRCLRAGDEVNGVWRTCGLCFSYGNPWYSSRFEFWAPEKNLCQKFGCWIVAKFQQNFAFPNAARLRHLRTDVCISSTDNVPNLLDASSSRESYIRVTLAWTSAQSMIMGPYARRAADASIVAREFLESDEQNLSWHFTTI